MSRLSTGGGHDPRSPHCPDRPRVTWALSQAPTKRLPVRDPLAGILMDWFGIMSGSAKVLAALYAADRPMLKDELSKRTTLAPGALPAYCARLRGAGLEIPSSKGRRHVGYSLSPRDRRQVREAFAWTARLLGAEVPSLERHEALEHALGLDVIPDAQYGLTRTESALYGLLTKVRVLSKERAFVALYGHLDEPPQEKIIDVLICKVRAKLARHGIGVENVWGRGYRIVRPDVKEAA